MQYENSDSLSSTILFMRHPEAAVLDNFCPELHKGTSWKKLPAYKPEKFCIFLPPVQLMKSPQMSADTTAHALVSYSPETEKHHFIH